MLYLFVYQKKGEIMGIYLFLLEEGECYICMVALVMLGMHSLTRTPNVLYIV